MRCLLLGTSTFAIPTAEVLARSTTCTLVGVITKPDEPVGRTQTLSPPPLAAWAKERDVRCWQPSTKEALTGTLREVQPDVAVVVAYGKIIPHEALAVPRFGFVNIHPSLLPRWRGPSPIVAAIAAGDAETGVTIMLLDAQVDHGPILAQERIPITTATTRAALEAELAEHGATLLARVLPEHLAGRVTPQPQDDAQATTCPLLTRDDGRLDWRQPAGALERMVRAYDGWPGTWCVLPTPTSISTLHSVRVPTQRGEKEGVGRRLKILAAALGGTTDSVPGTIIHTGGMFSVSCGDGRLLTLMTVQPEGKAAMSGAEFLRGHRTVTTLH